MERSKKNFVKSVCTNAIQNATWIIVWSLSYVLSLSAIEKGWVSAGAPSLALILLSSGIGLGMILSFRKHLVVLDELQRKIQLDALAITVGVTLIGVGAYSLLNKAGVLDEFKAEWIICIICFTYSGAVFAGTRRYL